MLKALGPVRLAFLGSLMLSLVVAFSGNLINKDGILYVETARFMIEQGVTATSASRSTDWQFLSMLIAVIGSSTGIGPETVAHLLNALFMAGTCAVLVAITRSRLPEAAWVACLVALAMPAYNGYRSEILREFGFWFFCMMAFWLAMRWEETGRWREAIACQLALCLAALFRLEAVAFFPALVLWQAFSAPTGLRLSRMLRIGCVPLAGIALATAIYVTGLAPLPHKVFYYLDSADPRRKIQIFAEAAARLTEAVLNKYSREEAGYVLFFGLLTIIPVKFLKMSGVFVIPFVYRLSVQPLRAWLARWQPLPWVFLAHVLVLGAFVTHQFFLVGRYIGLLHLMAVPVVAGGLMLLLQRYPRWRALMIGLALLTMLANVVSISPRKTHIVEAGAWLSANAADLRRVYVDNARVAYYAGWGGSSSEPLERPALEQALAAGRFDMVVLEVSHKDAGIEPWLEANHLKVLKHFANKAGDEVVIAAAAQGSRTATPPLRSNSQK